MPTFSLFDFIFVMDLHSTTSSFTFLLWIPQSGHIPLTHSRQGACWGTSPHTPKESLIAFSHAKICKFQMSKIAFIKETSIAIAREIAAWPRPIGGPCAVLSSEQLQFAQRDFYFRPAIQCAIDMRLFLVEHTRCAKHLICSVRCNRPIQFDHNAACANVLLYCSIDSNQN